MKSLMRHERAGVFLSFLEEQRDALARCALMMDGPGMYRVQGASLVLDEVVNALRRSTTT